MTKLWTVSAAITFAGALLIGLASWSIGAQPLYVAGQMIALVGLAVLIFLAPRMPFIAAVIAISTIVKNLAISQVVKILLLERADVGMPAPVETVWAIAVGTWGFVFAAAIYVAFKPSETWETTLSRPLPRAQLNRVAWTLLVIGLIGKLVLSATGGALVVFTFAGDLVFSAAAAFAYDVWRRTDRRELLDWRVVVSLSAALLISLQGGSKFAILNPFLFVAILYACFRVRPPLKFAVPVIAMFLALSSLVYPIVNYARATAGGGAGGVATVLVELIDNPSSFAVMNAASQRVEGAWAARLYYGRQLGMLDRFTPSQVAAIVSVADYSQYDVGAYVARAVRGLLPQTLGFQRDALASRSDVESAFQRHSVHGFNNANYGMVAELRLYGGLIGVFVGCAAILGLLMAVYTIAFGGQRNDIWALSLGLHGVFWLADQGLASNMIAFVHGPLIVWGITFGVIVAVRLFSASTPAVGHRSQPIPG